MNSRYFAILMAAGWTATAAAQLPGPAGVAATITSASSARLTWMSGKVLGYQVLRYRADNPKVPEAQSAQLDPSVTQWDDRGLLAGVSYQYVVAALYPRGTGQTAVFLSMPATLVKSVPNDLSTAQISSTSLIGSRALAAGLLPPPPPAPPPAAVLSSLTPASPYPGQTVTLTGANLSGVTAITVGKADLSVAGPNPPLGATAVVPATAITNVDANHVSFQWPLNPSWWLGIGVRIQLTTAAGTSTSPFDVTVDRQPYITGATKPLTRAGGHIDLVGRNLDNVTGGYIGAVAPNTASNPRLAASPGWMGLSASIFTPTNCSREGILLLEGTTTSGAVQTNSGFVGGTTQTGLVTTLGATPVRGGCGITPTGTSVSPQMGRPGTTVRVTGQGFTWMTGVQIGSTSLQWTPISDTQFDLVLPNVPGNNGGLPLNALLLNNIPDGTLAGSLTSPPIVAYPPLIQGLSTTWAECCESVTLSGKGLTDGTASRPLIKLNGVAIPASSASYSTATFQIPNPAPGGPSGPVSVYLEHAGGSSTAPQQLIVVDGPTTISSITPADIPYNVATTVTVRGTNLARARGICLPGTDPSGPVVPRTDLYPASNTEFQVVVQAYTTSGPIRVAQAPNVAQRQYTVCLANATPVNINVH